MTRQMTAPAGLAAFPAGPWRGRWIWADAPESDTARARTVVALRRQVSVRIAPRSVPARIAAVGRYVLFVNGAEVARGPLRADPLQQPYDVMDLAPYLRVGDNTLGLLAWTYAQPMPWWLPAAGPATDLSHGGLAFEALIDGEWLLSGREWSARPLPAWSMTPPEGITARGVERLDARALEEGWSAAGPPGEARGSLGWCAAIERRPVVPGGPHRAEPPSYPFGPHGPRSLSWPQPAVAPLSRRGMGMWVSPQLVAGTVRVGVSGPPGAVVLLRVAERLDALGRPAPGAHDCAFEVVCDGGERLLETLDAYGLSGLDVAADAGAAVTSVEVVERLHPLTGEAAFRCSDERLDAIWAAGRRTVSLCSWDAYLDCPTREQRAWTGDAVVHQMVDLATNSDWTLARWHPRLSASPRSDGMLPMAVAGDLAEPGRVIIADWALHWVHSVFNLQRYIGDRAEIAALLPVAEGVLRWFARSCGDDGVPTDLVGGVLIDWASVYTDGVSAALCGLWGRALLEFATMAEWLGDDGRAVWARERHQHLARGFEALWDPARSRYADVLRDGVRQPMASQHGQAAALVGGLVPASRIDRLVALLLDRKRLVDAAFSAPRGPALPGSEVEVGGAFLWDGPPEPWWDVDTQMVRAQPFFRYVVHDALAAAGRADAIAEACLDWTDSLARCPTSLSETWYGGTICHAWSATPTRDLSTYVLGVQPAEPGFAVARIAPALGALDWVSGSVPTPAGMIHVQADRHRVAVDSPVPFDHAGARRPAGRHEIEVAR